jgi:hypothetical protein
MKENPIEMESEFKYPIEISGIKKISPRVNDTKAGSLVKIRPCADEYKDKTYLGIYMGDIPVDFHIGLYTKTNILSIVPHGNPAIFVPDLKKIIFGYESWWGVIKSEEEVKEITDDDIDNVWYVKLLKQMIEKEDGIETGSKDTKIK